MKRFLMLGVAIASMGDLMQCPILIPDEGDPPRCDNIVVITPPNSCFELPIDPCTHVPWTRATSMMLSPESRDVRLDWIADASVTTPALCVQTSIPSQTAYHYTFFVNGDSSGQGDFLVTAENGLAVSASAAPGTINPGGSSQLAVTVSGGTEPYHYAWDIDPTLSATNIASPIARPTTTTLYRVVVSDAQNHSGQAVVSVQVVGVEAPSPVRLRAVPATVDSGGSVHLIASTTGMTLPLTYQWSTNILPISVDPSDVLTLPLSLTSSFNVTITDAHGQVGTATVEVPVRVGVSPSASPQSLFPGQTAVLQANAVGGDGHYHYLWTAPPPVSVSDPLASYPTTTLSTTTTYTVVVADEHGQQGSGNVTITVMPAPELTASFTYHQPSNSPVPFFVTLDASASTGIIVSYEWDLSWVQEPVDLMGQFASFSRTQESLRGTITLTVRDASGNTATASRPYP